MIFSGFRSYELMKFMRWTSSHEAGNQGTKRLGGRRGHYKECDRDIQVTANSLAHFSLRATPHPTYS